MTGAPLRVHHSTAAVAPSTPEMQHQMYISFFNQTKPLRLLANLPPMSSTKD